MTKNTWIELLKITSKDNINLLKDVGKHIKFNKNGKYCFIPYSRLFLITQFIDSLETDQLYTVIPLISFDGKNENPHLILSEQILITKYSDPKTIFDFINNQLDIAIQDFGINNLDRFHYLIFKYKKIVLEI
jgi:hypothetical protein